mmetsp:Transcript_22895/g.56934  ORF Transcript_22895/g.56934 Transcript_22895/m.56934 type:complete len:268 (+) Transcript_22895:329-1132(+)
MAVARNTFASRCSLNDVSHISPPSITAFASASARSWSSESSSGRSVSWRTMPPFPPAGRTAASPGERRQSSTSIERAPSVYLPSHSCCSPCSSRSCSHGMRPCSSWRRKRWLSSEYGSAYSSSTIVKYAGSKRMRKAMFLPSELIDSPSFRNFWRKRSQILSRRCASSTSSCGISESSSSSSHAARPSFETAGRLLLDGAGPRRRRLRLPRGRTANGFTRGGELFSSRGGSAVGVLPSIVRGERGACGGVGVRVEGEGARGAALVLR